MAYIKDPLEAQQDGSQPMTTSGQSSVVTGGANQDPNASAAQGTSWTNLSKYLGANEGLGGGIADAVTAGTQSKVDSAAGKINEYQSKAATANTAGKEQASTLQGYQTQITKDPTKIDTTAFRNAVANPYQGITDATKVDGYTDASAKFGDAKADYTNLKNDDWNARSSVVQGTYGKDNASYSKGMGLLDTLILQGDAKGQEGINNFTSKNASFIGDDTTNALTAAKTGVQSTYDADRANYDSLLGKTDQVVADKRAAILSGSGVATGRYNEADRQAQAAEAAILERFRQNGAKTPDSLMNYYKTGDVSGYIAPDELAALNTLADLDGGTQYASKSGDAAIDWSAIMRDVETSKPGFSTIKDGKEYFYDPAGNLITIRDNASTTAGGFTVDKDGYRVYYDKQGKELSRTKI
ncbi:MAG: hypothetical protein EOO38_11065 [Cytophagaceae bacterium]|nr:MAG: hypothetical protein EOO38_11065 [Cytophagaceae bacterium]